MQNYLESSGYHKDTVRNYLNKAESFFIFLEQNEIEDLRDVKKSDLSAYAQYLNRTPNKYTGRELKKTSKREKIQVVKILFKSLYVMEMILVNPAEDFKAFAKAKSKEREIMSQTQVSYFLDKIDNIRDRAIFETMYSSGLRVSEVSNLNYEDIDFEARLLHIRQSKFKKDRIVPITEAAVRILKKYINGNRKKGDAVFYGMYGRLGKYRITEIFRKYANEFKMYKEGLCAHSLRHCTATHLLENGADIRYVQELLGHEHIETTVGYTHMMYEATKRIYKMYHTRENEYYEEIKDEYLKDLANLKEQLDSPERERKKKWYRENEQKKDC